MKYILFILFGFLILMPGFSRAGTQEFARYEMGFKNFLTCEFTRTNAKNHFNGKAFKITMIDLFDIQQESGMVIITGAVQCLVGDDYYTLFAALGVETILDREQVNYYIIRKKDFSILATELIKFPYKDRCPWSRYWVDTD
jgi:hypothetical protein